MVLRQRKNKAKACEINENDATRHFVFPLLILKLGQSLTTLKTVLIKLNKNKSILIIANVTCSVYYKVKESSCDSTNTPYPKRGIKHHHAFIKGI